jgi:hypothetical protein
MAMGFVSVRKPGTRKQSEWANKSVRIHSTAALGGCFNSACPDGDTHHCLPLLQSAE